MKEGNPASKKKSAHKGLDFYEGRHLRDEDSPSDGASHSSLQQHRPPPTPKKPGAVHDKSEQALQDPGV
jgi:hypothetical protein